MMPKSTSTYPSSKEASPKTPLVSPGNRSSPAKALIRAADLTMKSVEQTDQENQPGTPTEVVLTDSSPQLRTTLALGELLASKRPTAGSRLIATEIRDLSSTLRKEAAEIRKGLNDLVSNLTEALKETLEEDRERRTIAASGFGRRVAFGGFSRRFPIFRRGRRFPLQFARKSTVNASTSTASMPSVKVSEGPAAAPASSPSNNISQKRPTDGQHRQTAQKNLAKAVSNSEQMDSNSANSVKSLNGLIKNPWFLSNVERGSTDYDGEADSELTDSSPASTP